MAARWIALESVKSVWWWVVVVVGSGGSPLPTLLGLPMVLVMVVREEDDAVLVACRNGCRKGINFVNFVRNED